MVRGTILCLAVLFVASIDAYCSIERQNLLQKLSQRYNALTSEYTRLDNLYNQSNDSENLRTFNPAVYTNNLADVALSSFKVSMRIPVQQFVYCQSLIKSEVVNSVRSQNEFREYRSMENQMNILVKRWNDLISSSRSDFEEVRVRLQNLETDNCTNLNKIRNDAGVIDVQLELLWSSIIQPVQAVAKSFMELKNSASLQLQALSKNVEKVVADLKLRRDIKACLAY